jgi:hypothetical protein
MGLDVRGALQALALRAGVDSSTWRRTPHRLFRLRAESWVGRGDHMPPGYGFAEEAHTVSVEVLTNGQTQTFTVEFGRMNLRQNRYAATRLDGHRMIFEFPRQVYEEVLRDLTVPPPATAQ